jgi:L-malate glycosyltransferase
MGHNTEGTRAPRPVPILLMVRELDIGGCENDLTKLAVGIDRTRFEPHVGCLFARGIRMPQLQSAKVPILELPVRGLLSPSWLVGGRMLRRYIRDHKIQLVHTFDAPMDLVAIPVAWAARVPVLIKSHLWYRGALPRREQLCLAATDHLVDAIVVNSRAVQRELVEHHRVSVDRTYLCYNGVDTGVFHPEGETDRPPNATLTIGTVCALRSEKRLDVLFRAFALARGAGLNARLVVVGSGPMAEPLEALRRQLGIEDSSELHATTSDVAHWMRKFDIFVLSSDTESFPNALLEAMACGCCVVASDVGGVPELVRTGENGLLFESGNADQLTHILTALAADTGRRRALGAEAARTARTEFSIERNVASIERTYDSLLSRDHA